MEDQQKIPCVWIGCTGMMQLKSCLSTDVGYFHGPDKNYKNELWVCDLCKREFKRGFYWYLAN